MTGVPFTGLLDAVEALLRLQQSITGGVGYLRYCRLPG